MSELYRVEVVSHDPLSALPKSPFLDGCLLRLAQDAKWKDIASFKKDARAAFAKMVKELKAEPDAKAAEKRFPADSKLLDKSRALKGVALQLAGHRARSDGAFVELKVRSIHPDAGMPDHTDPFRTLDSFVLRLLADGAPQNEVKKRYPRLTDGKVSPRSGDLWDYKLEKPRKVKPLSKMPGKFFESSLTIVTDAPVLAHLKRGAAYASWAYPDGPAAKFGR